MRERVAHQRHQRERVGRHRPSKRMPRTFPDSQCHLHQSPARSRRPEMSAAMAAAVAAGPATVGVAVVATLVCVIAVAVLSSSQRRERIACLAESVPRTMRTLWWATRAGVSYWKLMALHRHDHENEGYVAASSQVGWGSRGKWVQHGPCGRTCMLGSPCKCAPAWPMLVSPTSTRLGDCGRLGDMGGAVEAEQASWAASTGFGCETQGTVQSLSST